MSREDFVAIASRLFAVFIFVSTLSFAVGSVQLLYSSQDSPFAIISTALMLIIMLALAAVLWLFPLTVARKILPVMKEQRPEEKINSSTALSLSLTVIGFWFLARAVTDSAYWIMMLLYSRTADFPGLVLTPDQKSNIVATVVQLALSLWLIFGSTSINRVLRRLKYAGGSQGAL